MNLTRQQCAAMLTEHHPNPFIQLSNQGYFIQCGCGARPYIGDPDQVWKVWGDHVAGALLADDTPAHPDTTQRVHNHLYGGWPFCNERTVDGQLRGACLNDEGSARVAQPVPTPEVSRGVAEVLMDRWEDRARTSSVIANVDRSRRAAARARIHDAIAATWLDARADLRDALGGERGDGA